jgi:hypothetical protein
VCSMGSIKENTSKQARLGNSLWCTLCLDSATLQYPIPRQRTLHTPRDGVCALQRSAFVRAEQLICNSSSRLDTASDENGSASPPPMNKYKGMPGLYSSSSHQSAGRGDCKILLRSYVGTTDIRFPVLVHHDIRSYRRSTV